MTGVESTAGHAARAGRLEESNFHVSFPLWYWLLGTVLPATEREGA